MKYQIQSSYIYEFGQRRDAEGKPHQEDWIFPAAGQADDLHDRLFILCDGMGGHAAGEVASQSVCEAMSQTILQALQSGQSFTDELLQEAIDAAYRLLDERDSVEEGGRKMGTTMTLLMLHAQGATIAHIGDSRVYHIRPSQGKATDICFRTRDHSLVEDLIRLGELDEESAKTFHGRNVITRAMQPHLERPCRADIYHTADLRPGDYFYLCSDGMLEEMSDDSLCFNLACDISAESGDTELQKRANRLIAVTRGNRDNHSAYLIKLLDVQPLPAELQIPDTQCSREAVTTQYSHEANTTPQPSTFNVQRSRLKFRLLIVLSILLAAVAVGYVFLQGKKGDKSAGHQEAIQQMEQAIDIIDKPDTTKQSEQQPAKEQAAEQKQPEQPAEQKKPEAQSDKEQTAEQKKTDNAAPARDHR